jgi:hypothetical protein
MAKTDTEENVPWTTSDIFGWVFTVISFAIAVSALVIAVLVYQRDEFSPNIVIDSLVATIGSITGLFTASSIVSTTLVVGAAVPVPPAVRSLHASQVLSFPLKVDEAGRTLIRNLTVTNFECTGSGCPSGSVPIPPPLTSISVAGSFPISTGAVPQAVTTFSKGDSGARVTLSEVYSPDASKLVLRGMTGVDLQASNVTVASVSSTGLAVTGPITSTGVISAGNITLGTKPLTGSATAVCGNGILEPGEQCDSTPQSVFCDENCHYGQVFPYYQDATTAGPPPVTSTFGDSFGGVIQAGPTTTPIPLFDAIPSISSLRELGDTVYFDTTPGPLSSTQGSIKTTFSNATGVVTRLTFSFNIAFTTLDIAHISTMSFSCAVYDNTVRVSAEITRVQFTTNPVIFNLESFVTSTVAEKTYMPRCTASYVGVTPGAALQIKPTSYSASATIIDL